MFCSGVEIKNLNISSTKVASSEHRSETEEDRLLLRKTEVLLGLDQFPPYVTGRLNTVSLTSQGRPSLSGVTVTFLDDGSLNVVTPGVSMLPGREGVARGRGQPL